MSKKPQLALFIGFCCFSATAAAAEPAKSPEVMAKLSACRTVPGTTERLACYDAAAAAFESAIAKREVTVVDRERVREARRMLFGLEMPKFPFFGDKNDDDKEERIDAIDAVVASAVQNGYGKWVVKLQEGGSWTQIDSAPLVGWPKPGAKVKIRRAALGSYMMRVEGQPGIRVKRSL